MKIKITKGGIYGADGEIAIGTEIEVKSDPVGWAGRYETISGGSKKEKTFVTGENTGLKAVHFGGGKFNIVNGDDVLAKGLSKADSDAFNGMSDDDKAAYAATLKTE